jgi:hypothetical protein
MSDNVHWIVNLDVSLEQAPACAGQVTEWLLASGIILPTYGPERSYDGDFLFEPGARTAQWGQDLASLTGMCGLAVVIERRIYHTGGNGIDGIACGACGTVFDDAHLPWSDAVDGWWKDDERQDLACPACQVKSRIVDWTFDLPWGFGNLGFGFWNWSIDASLVEQVAGLTGHRWRFVSEHI